MGCLCPSFTSRPGMVTSTALVLQALLQGLGLQLTGGGLNGRLQSGADLVGHLAHGGALLGGQLAHHFQNGGELTLLAQILDAQAVQLGGGLACPKAASASERIFANCSFICVLPFRGKLIGRGRTAKSLPPQTCWDERQPFRGTTRIRVRHALELPDNGGTAVPLSGAAPGRTKRHASGRLSAGDHPSLRNENTLFSRSSHLY